MLYTSRLNEARAAADKIDAALVAVQNLADGEPQEFPMRARIMELRRIARALAKLEADLDRVFE